MSLMILIILASGVFLVGGVAPKMHDDTLNMASTDVVEGVKSDGVSGSSFAAAPGTNNESKKSLQMKQLILTTATPIPSVTPTRIPTITPSTSDEASITVALGECDTEKDPIVIGSATAISKTSGYLLIDIETSTGTFATFQTLVFSGVTQKYNLILTARDGFMTKNWRIKLISGGIKVGTEYIGGKQAAIKSFSPIDC